MQLLVDARIVNSQRGLGGGFVLAREPERVTVLDVINAVEPIPRIRTCPLHLSSHAVRLCPLHQRLDDALATVERVFADSTLAEMLTGDRPERPLCTPSDEPSRPATGNLAVPSGRRPDVRRGRPRRSR
jgi:DNA-binding IscR family transcriptional regulator